MALDQAGEHGADAAGVARQHRGVRLGNQPKCNDHLGNHGDFAVRLSSARFAALAG